MDEGGGGEMVGRQSTMKVCELLRGKEMQKGQFIQQLAWQWHSSVLGSQK